MLDPPTVGRPRGVITAANWVRGDRKKGERGVGIRERGLSYDQRWAVSCGMEIKRTG